MNTVSCGGEDEDENGAKRDGGVAVYVGKAAADGVLVLGEGRGIARCC